MGLIEVNGIRMQAFHGCLDEEGRIGGNYRVDVSVEGDFSRAEANDHLEDTVDYGKVASIVREQMAIRRKLIEHVCKHIMVALKEQWPQHRNWTVRVVKERPPINGNVDEAVYTMKG